MRVMKITTCLLGSWWEWNELIRVRCSGHSLSHSKCPTDAAVAGDSDDRTDLGFLGSSVCVTGPHWFLTQLWWGLCLSDISGSLSPFSAVPLLSPCLSLVRGPPGLLLCSMKLPPTLTFSAAFPQGWSCTRSLSASLPSRLLSRPHNSSSWLVTRLLSIPSIQKPRELQPKGSQVQVHRPMPAN